MRICILTLGTRGDVQPYLALGKGLAQQGHQVRLAGPENFETWVTEHGLEFHPAGLDMQAFLRRPETRRALASGMKAMGRLWRRQLRSRLPAMLEATWQAARDAEILVYHPKVIGALDVAEANHAVPICAALLPLFPTRAFPAIPLSGNLGGTLNRATYQLYKASRLAYRGIVDRWRRQFLGLDKGPAFAPLGGLHGKLFTRLCAISPSVLPQPQDWDEHTHICGYWFLDAQEDWQPEPQLASFLAAGPAPVYVGFGSMTTQDPLRLLQEVVAGITGAGLRAVLASGWGGLASPEELSAQLPDTVHLIESAPHDVLFRHVAAVVHHGGAGTFAAGLRAGRPTWICPLLMDQPYWGRRVVQLGCGPRPLPLRHLRAEAFALGLKDLVGNASYASNAQRIGERIAREDGVGTAIEIIQQSGRASA